MTKYSVLLKALLVSVAFFANTTNAMERARDIVIPPGNTQINRFTPADVALPTDPGGWSSFWATDAWINYLANLKKSGAAAAGNELAAYNDRFAVVGTSITNDMQNIQLKIAEINDFIRNQRNNINNMMNEEATRLQGVIRNLKNEKITWKQDVQARLEERHNENDCDKCLGISPTLTTHREFCNSDTVLEKMMLAFEGYCYFASNAWLLEKQSRHSKAGNDEEQTPFTNLQEKTLKKLGGLAGRIRIPENAGNFPRHRYDHSVLLADTRIPAHIAREINQLNAQTNSRALNLQKDVRTQTSEAVPDFNHADAFVEELEQNEHVPRPFSEQETQVIGVPQSGLIGRLGKTAWQIGVGIAGSSSTIGAASAAGTAIFKSIDAETSKLSATKAAKVHNEASRVCKAADDNWKIMKYEAQRNLRKIRTELLPLIQSLRDHSVPTEFVEALVAQCATQTTALSAQVQTAETEMQTCHNEVSEALNAHIARQECYATSQRYAQESFEQMKRKIQDRLANTDLYAYKDLNGVESNTSGVYGVYGNNAVQNVVTAKAMKSYYKSALETFTDHIQCSVESNEQGFCQIAKDPLIKSTIDYWFAQFQNLCQQYTRELAKREYTRNYKEVLRDLIIAMTKYVL